MISGDIIGVQTISIHLRIHNIKQMAATRTMIENDELVRFPLYTIFSSTFSAYAFISPPTTNSICLNLSSLLHICPRFHPPPPFYKINYNEATGAYDIEFSPLAAHIDYENLTVELIRTKTKTTIPVLCLKYPGAKYTLIYSHGNATDCGAMFIMYAMLALTLKLNVVGYDYTGYGSSFDNGVRPTEKQTYKG